MNAQKFLPLIFAAVIATSPVIGQEEASSKDEKKPEAKKPEKSIPKPVTKKNKITISGKEISYEVTAGIIPLPDQSDPDKKRARIFHISYVADHPEDQPDRPIAFCFNGGPGSSSVWLHLGALGPRRIQLDDAGKGTTLGAPPYRLVDNEHSILDKADLVFIDPVNTGFSRPEEKKEAGQFHGLEGDIESVGAFIHQYCSQHGRWDSPKYLIGESYGGIRAAGLSHHLQSRYGMYLNGIVLVSALIDFATLRFNEGNDLPYIFFLPSYAATAFYHGKIEADSAESIYKDALEFANGDYAAGLLAGNDLPPEKRTEIISRLSALTGLSKEEIDRANLRLDSSYFRKLLLRDQKKSVGRFDSRVVGIDSNKASNYPDYDPSYSVVYGPFASGLNYYLREEIGFQSEEVYEILTGAVHPWDYKPFTNRYVNMAERLTGAMTENPHLRVFVAAGYYDLATPPAAIDYSLDHLPIDPSLRANFVFYFYEGGHMYYSNLEALAQFKTHVAEFMK